MASQDTVLWSRLAPIRCQQLPVRRLNCGVGSFDLRRMMAELIGHFRPIAVHLPVPRIGALAATNKWQRRTNVWREVTSPTRWFWRLTSDPQRGAFLWRCQLAGSRSRATSPRGARAWRNQSSPLSSAPVLLGLPLHRRCHRVLNLEPVLRAAGTVGRAEPLRDDAL
jgi:hypothetical protein